MIGGKLFVLFFLSLLNTFTNIPFSHFPISKQLKTTGALPDTTQIRKGMSNNTTCIYSDQQLTIYSFFNRQRQFQCL